MAGITQSSKGGPVALPTELTLERAKEIIRRLLAESTYPAWAGEDCRSCEAGHDLVHQKDCPYLRAVEEAEEFLYG